MVLMRRAIGVGMVGMLVGVIVACSGTTTTVGDGGSGDGAGSSSGGGSSGASSSSGASGSSGSGSGGSSNGGSSGASSSGGDAGSDGPCSAPGQCDPMHPNCGDKMMCCPPMVQGQMCGSCIGGSVCPG